MGLNLRHVITGIWLVALSLAVAALAWNGSAASSRTADFDTINAQRINIVEPDGRYRLILASRARFPGNFFLGKEYAHADRGGGMLFFNDEGDEVGGLILGSHATAEHHSAFSSFLFDQYRQDQIVGLQYGEEDGHRSAGLQVWDRPAYPMKPLFEMNDRATRAATDAERKAIRGKMMDYVNARGGVGESRMFVGKVDGRAVVRLADGDGRPRLALKVDSQGQASIEFLDEKGNIVRRISASPDRHAAQ